MRIFVITPRDQQMDIVQVFFQDEWQPPMNLKERILLFIGDPLMQVEVPWEPQSLVQNWSVDV